MLLFSGGDLPAYLPEVAAIVVFVSVILSPESPSLSVRSVVREGW